MGKVLLDLTKIVHDKAKIRAIHENKTLHDYIVELIQEDQE